MVEEEQMTSKQTKILLDMAGLIAFAIEKDMRYE